jgi:hypothetical protein
VPRVCGYGGLTYPSERAFLKLSQEGLLFLVYERSRKYERGVVPTGCCGTGSPRSAAVLALNLASSFEPHPLSRRPNIFRRSCFIDFRDGPTCMRSHCAGHCICRKHRLFLEGRTGA